ncbi:MAG: hypothetical protein J5790_10935 [Bacteroidaceae bacterium]|nr:hypothetical protein [Bacteroidaceae bacterium]
MSKRISWKKGMRLTDEVLLSADQCTVEAISQSLTLASAGRCGLLPSIRPFQLSLNISNGYVKVTYLDLLAITKAGDVIDFTIDGSLTDTSNTQIPLSDEDEELFLTINVNPTTWKDCGNGYMQPEYTFELITPQTTLSDHAMPIAHFMHNEDWEEDTARFLPPALYLSGHHRWEDLRIQLIDVLKSICEKTKPQAQSLVKTAISIYWPIVQKELIRVNTEHDTLTPAMLLGSVQSVVSGFAIACEVDEILTLEDAALFYNFAQVPYNYQKAYLRIKQGIGMCKAINEKIDKFSLLAAPPKPEPAPAPKPEPKPDPRRSWLGKQI